MEFYTTAEWYCLLGALWVVCLLANAYIGGRLNDDMEMYLDVALVGACWVLFSPAVTFVHLCRLVYMAGSSQRRYL